MSSQLILPVKPIDNKYDEFIVNEVNLYAYNSILDWQNWGNYPLQRIKYIYGAQASGKSCLVKLWQSLVSGVLHGDSYYIWENLEPNTNQEDLFNFLEKAIQKSSYVIITSRYTIEDLKFNLPDLLSRLNAIEKYYINPPNSELLRALLIKNFANKQIHVPNLVLDFLVKRIDRNYQAVQNIVENIDKLSLQEKRNITVALIKEITTD